MTVADATTRSERGSSFEDRLLTEAVFAYERGGTQRVAMSRSEGTPYGGFEHVLIERARSLQVAGVLRTALARIGRVLMLASLGMILAALIIGAVLAGALFSGGEGTPVNFYWLLLVAFGVQVAALLIWIAFSFVPGLASSASWVGRVLFAIFDLASRRMRATRVTTAAVCAWLTVLRSRQLARWSTGVASHGLWFTANCAFLLVALLLLSAKSYTFHWQTTILPDGVFVDLTRAIAWLPTQFGFAAPTAAQIAACGPGATHAALAEARTAWAAMLVGCIIVYGIAPRGVLLLSSLIALRVGKRRYRLDLDRFAGGYADLRPTVHAGARGLTAPDDDGLDEDLAALGGVRGKRAPTRRFDAPALIGIELPTSVEGLTCDGIDWARTVDIDGREDRDHVLAWLEDSRTEPQHVVVAVDIASVPDTGHARFIMQVAERTNQSLIALLCGGARLAIDLPDLAARRARLTQWRDMLRHAGIRESDVLPIDVECMTAHACNRLRLHLTASHGDEQVPERFAWWRTACAYITQAADDAAIDLDLLANMFQSRPVEDAAAANDIVSSIHQRGRDLKAGAREAVSAVRNPLQAVARRTLRAAAMRVDRKRTQSTPPVINEAIALAVMLDLQGRCESPLIEDVTRRVLKRMDSLDPDVARLMRECSDSYESLCEVEGIR